MRLGVLTGGGDCPGLNAVIRAIVRTGAGRDVTFVGFRDGWRGVLEDATSTLDPVTARGILHRGGTILGSSGVDPMRTDDGPDRVRGAIERHGLDGLVAIGGEGTLSAGAALAELGSPSSACRRRSTTTCRGPTSRSGSTRRSRWRATRSTGSTPPRNLTTA